MRFTGAGAIAVAVCVADALVIGRADASVTRGSLIVLVAANVLVLGGTGLLAMRSAARWNAACLRAREAELQAVQENDRLIQVIDNSSAVIYMKNSDGRYILINRRYEQLFNVKRESIAGMTDHDLFPKVMADSFRSSDLKALARGAPIQIEEVTAHADGPHAYITVKYPITDVDGRAYAVCGISTDITDLRRAEREVAKLITELELRVRQRTAELEASTRELDAFAYSVSHDLRAPLRAVAGFSEILLEDHAAQLDATGLDYLGRVRAAAERMAHLIDALLDLSRAGRAELLRRPVNLGDLAREIVAELAGAEPERDVEILVENLPAAGDIHLLTLVLQNLLSNSWKFTAGRPRARIHVGCTGADDDRAYFVRDNGAGFDMRYAEKLFVPFQRLHTAEEFPGTGIGLAIVARIIARHGGRTWAHSAPGQGTTFFFTLTPTTVGPPTSGDAE